MTRGVCLVCSGRYRDAEIPGLLQCESCSFQTANVELSDQELANLYSSNYFAGEEYHDYVKERPLIERHFRSRLKKLLPYIGDPAHKSLFEVGCAYGFFLSVAKTQFGSVAGIDISKDAIDYAASTLDLPVQAGDFLNCYFDAPVDVLCMWDTVEHLKNPDAYLAHAARNIRPGGIIALTTGDIDSAVARLRGRRWRQIHPPTHLHYFSKATLGRLLNKHGFTLCYSGSDGMFRSVDTMAYIILNIKHKYPKVYAALKRSRLLNWNIYLNFYDIMFLIGEKR
jgi:2-polyprenyl-3-methyl-5-hydroxy-6-metoxy-1,4-benzoquinol methylase